MSDDDLERKIRIANEFMSLVNDAASEGLTIPEAIALVGLLMLDNEQRAKMIAWAREFAIHDGKLSKKS